MEKFYMFSNTRKHDGLFGTDLKVCSFSIVSSVMCTSISCSDLINCYLCRVQRPEIIKVFSREIKMVNDDIKLQLMYLLFCLGYLWLSKFCMTFLLLNQKYL